MPPLSTIKFISDTLRVFYLLTGAIEISFNLRTACRQSTLRAFVYAVPDTGAQGLMPELGAVHLVSVVCGKRTTCVVADHLVNGLVR